MKYACLICIVTVLVTPLYSTEKSEGKEPSKPTWIERIFGLGDEEVEGQDEENIEKKEKPKNSKEAEKPAARKFTAEEREVLESWQKGNASWKKSKKSKKPLPPGLRKKLERGGELPPGWKKKLEVGSVLDPEVDEVAESLPEEILKRLPETEETAEIVRVGKQIIKVIEGSREIVDIIDGDSNNDSDRE